MIFFLISLANDNQLYTNLSLGAFGNFSFSIFDGARKIHNPTIITYEYHKQEKLLFILCN